MTDQQRLTAEQSAAAVWTEFTGIGWLVLDIPATLDKLIALEAEIAELRRQPAQAEQPEFGQARSLGAEYELADWDGAAADAGHLGTPFRAADYTGELAGGSWADTRDGTG